HPPLSFPPRRSSDLPPRGSTPGPGRGRSQSSPASPRRTSRRSRPICTSAPRTAPQKRSRSGSSAPSWESEPVPATLITGDSLLLLVVSLAVGDVIGHQGMGGGALMTPALILVGIPPTAAVANDLVVNAVNKVIGAGVHWRSGKPNLQIAF